MKILGLSAYYHDSAACLLVDGDIVAAAQEEPFTRRKHDSAFPSHAVRYCLAEAKIRPDEIDHVVFYDKPFVKFERILETYLAFAPRGRSPRERPSGGTRGGWSSARGHWEPVRSSRIHAPPAMQRQLNLKVKYRESIRPFAPSVLREDVSDWFDLGTDSPYMTLVADVAESKRLPMSREQEQLSGIDRLNTRRSTIPAVTHVDHSARIQTVHKETNPRFHRLITRFKELTACPDRSRAC